MSDMPAGMLTLGEFLLAEGQVLSVKIRGILLGINTATTSLELSSSRSDPMSKHTVQGKGILMLTLTKSIS